MAYVTINGQRIKLNNENGYYSYTFTAGDNQNIDIEQICDLGGTELSEISLREYDGSFTTNPIGAEYIGVAVTNSEAPPPNKSDYKWTLIKGSDGKDGRSGRDGEDGIAGKDGVGVTSTTIHYAGHNDGVNPPTSGWQADVPVVSPGYYLWTRTTWVYTDGTSETGYSVSKIGKNGNDGKDGIAGKDGVGITSTNISYTSSSSGTSTPVSGWVSYIPYVAPGNFLWTRTIWYYSDGTDETGYSVSRLGTNGKDGKDGTVDYDYLIANGYVSYSANPPSDTTRLWVDSNSYPRVMYYYDPNMELSSGQTSRDRWIPLDNQITQQMTNLEQTINEFNFSFTSVSEFQDEQSSTSIRFAEINKYIRFIDGKVHISEDGNPFNIIISNDRISFMNNDMEIAYCKGDEFYVDKLQALTKLTVGNIEITNITSTVAGIVIV